MQPTRAGAQGHRPAVSVKPAPKREHFTAKHLRHAFLAGCKASGNAEKAWIEWATERKIIE